MKTLRAYYHRYLVSAHRRLGLSPRAAATVLVIAVLAGASAGAWIAATVVRVTFFGNREAVQIDQTLACSSAGTPFADMSNFDIIRQYYHLEMGNMLDEQEEIVTVTQGRCDALDDEDFLPTTEIAALAETLPGWRGEISFSSFEPVLLEFARAYECKLDEMIFDARQIVMEGEDLPDEPLPQTFDDIESRVTVFTAKLREEKRQSRLAFERTMNLIRSFQMSAPITKELTCLQLESLDLRNAMSLMADSMSCMPRIWDAVTSLHERSSSE